MKLKYLLILYFLLAVFFLIIIINRFERKWKKHQKNSIKKDIYENINKIEQLIEEKKKNFISKSQQKISHTFDENQKNFSLPPSGNQKKLEGFNIMVINLPQSKARADSVLEQFEKLGLEKPNLLEAIDGRDLTSKYSAKKGYVNIGKIPKEFGNFKGEARYKNNGDITPPELGCTLSHIKAILEAYKNKAEYSLICEDDISFLLLPLWKVTLKEIISDAPPSWDIISIYTNCKSHAGNFLNPIENRCWGTVCYIINKKGCKKLLEKVFINSKLFLDKNKSLHKSTSADNFIIHLVESYTYHRSLVLPMNLNRDTDSTIHPEHTHSHLIITNNIIQEHLNDLKVNENIFIEPKN